MRGVLYLLDFKILVLIFIEILNVIIFNRNYIFLKYRFILRMIKVLVGVGLGFFLRYGIIRVKLGSV